MSVLFVSSTACVATLVLALGAWWRGRFRRAAEALAAPVGPRPAVGPLRASRVKSRVSLPFPFGYLNRRLRTSGIPVDLRTVVLLCAVGAVGCWAAATLILGSGWPSALAAVGGLYVPIAWVDRLVAARREKVALEMERVIAALEGAVSAGMVVYEALLEVGLSVGGILGAELLRVVADADRIGASEALLLLGQRLPLPEVSLLVAALRLNQGAGAELAGSLSGLGRTLRERRETVAAMRAATAAGRWQANILIGVPPLLLLFMRWTYPEFETPLFGTAAGQLLLVVSGVWLCLGYVILRRMCVPREMI